MIAAVEAGADVYVQKPTAVDGVESQARLAAARKHGRVVQAGPAPEHPASRHAQGQRDELRLRAPGQWARHAQGCDLRARAVPGRQGREGPRAARGLRDSRAHGATSRARRASSRTSRCSLAAPSSGTRRRARSWATKRPTGYCAGPTARPGCIPTPRRSEVLDRGGLRKSGRSAGACAVATGAARARLSRRQSYIGVDKQNCQF